jgi:hypothetical protein
LQDHHVITGFDCGKPQLNQWLLERSRKSQGRTARTFVVVAEGRVIAFYSLSAGSVERDALPTARLRRDTPQPVPVLVIGRLAVDLKFKVQGYGRGLLKDAILRSLTLSTEVGFLAIIVHAHDGEGVTFYPKYGFLQSPTNERTFILPMETARAALD